jgi:hypothetical protein
MIGALVGIFWKALLLIRITQNGRRPAPNGAHRNWTYLGWDGVLGVFGVIGVVAMHSLWPRPGMRLKLGTRFSDRARTPCRSPPRTIGPSRTSPLQARRSCGLQTHQGLMRSQATLRYSSHVPRTGASAISRAWTGIGACNASTASRGSSIGRAHAKPSATTSMSTAARRS